MDELEQRLQDQVAFLDASCDGYDRGAVREAYRLATTIRVLVHDTGQSHSLLGQLGLKATIQYIDGSTFGFENLPPMGPNAVQSTPGLAVIAHFYTPEGSSRDASEYWPVYAIGDAPLIDSPLVSFDDWWKTPVLTDTHGTRQFRRHFILAGANKDGGAHVDTVLDREYAGYKAVTRDGSMGTISMGSFVSSQVGTPASATDQGMSPGPAIIRQIAEELRVGLRLQLAPLLGELADAPPAVEIEKPFMFTGATQTVGPPGMTFEFGPRPVSNFP